MKISSSPPPSHTYLSLSQPQRKPDSKDAVKIFFWRHVHNERNISCTPHRNLHVVLSCRKSCRKARLLYSYYSTIEVHIITGWSECCFSQNISGGRYLPPYVPAPTLFDSATRATRRYSLAYNAPGLDGHVDYTRRTAFQTSVLNTPMPPAKHFSRPHPWCHLPSVISASHHR